MVRTKAGRYLKPLNELFKSGSRYLNLYVRLKRAAGNNQVVADGLRSLREYIRRAEEVKVIWSYETLLNFHYTQDLRKWDAAIAALYPYLGQDEVREWSAKIGGIVLLDALTESENHWVMDDLDFDDIDERIEHKRYERTETDA